MAHPALSAESIHRVSETMASKTRSPHCNDPAQHFPIRRRSAEGYGFGESAGGTMICYLMASPLARGLFQRAILESCTCQDYISPN